MAVGGERDHRPAVTALAQQRGGGVAVQNRHVHVHEEHIEGLPAASSARAWSTAWRPFRGGLHGRAAFLQEGRNEKLVVRSVLGEQNAERQGELHLVSGGSAGADSSGARSSSTPLKIARFNFPAKVLPRPCDARYAHVAPSMRPSCG